LFLVFEDNRVICLTEKHRGASSGVINS